MKFIIKAGSADLQKTSRLHPVSRCLLQGLKNPGPFSLDAGDAVK